MTSRARVIGTEAEHGRSLAIGAEDCLAIMDRIVLGYGKEHGPETVTAQHSEFHAQGGKRS